MRVLWYWPHPSRGESELARAVVGPGDTLTVQCLESFRGQRLTDDAVAYRVVRDLPDVDRSATGRVRRIANRLAVHTRRSWRRDRLVSTGDFDVVHIQTVTPLDALFVRRLRKRSAVVVVVHDVRPHESRLPAPVERRLLARVYRDASRLVVYHDAIKAGLVKQFGVGPDQVAVVPHPLILQPARDAGPPVAGAALRVLFFGSLRANKGLTVLLEAVQRLSPEAVVLTVAGAGAADLEALVTAVAARQPNVIAEIGFVSAERREVLFSGTDVVVLPYLADFGSQSGVLFDAYAHGVPVIASDVGAIGPTVGRDDTGWLVPPGDADALAKTLASVASDPEGHSRAARRTREAAQGHSQPVVGRALREVYRDAIDLDTGGSR